MWTPFTALPGAKRGEQPAPSEKDDKSTPPKKEADDLGELKAQLASMQQKIDKLSQDRE
jgi:polyhydroxyalkanoate synthesis regulator protein